MNDIHLLRWHIIETWHIMEKLAIFIKTCRSCVPKIQNSMCLCDHWVGGFMV
uniref:Uncharacterized protein n=1 Tax=Anguilla anguilla TaxID=7936 RepID=A0A0E9RZV2_ANGAN